MGRPPAADFAGTDRYDIVRRLGGGAMGVVYEVHDRERDTRVALKHLRRADPAWLYQFKQEFRALADVSHPNLVTLHELVAAENQWFFTMELVGGDDFLRYVRFGTGAPRFDAGEALAETIAPPDTPGHADTPGSTPGSSGSGGSGRAPTVEAPATAPDQIARLRQAMGQLAAGVEALHRAGKLHRDLKPSNILVAACGRVVILDFGLVAEAGRREAREVVGTPAYMAPEQGATGDVSAASDWYSVGVVLYEALTGRVPFRGRHLEVLAAKQSEDPTPVRELAPDAPADLAALCEALLARDPAARPDGPAVLRALGASEPQLDSVPAMPDTPDPDAPMVGREGQLDALRAAFDSARAGATVVVAVSGLSGMGKSTLVRRFLDELREHPASPLVLDGRCYERESVPYKAVDSVVDALSRALSRAPRAQVDALVTGDVVALGRLFPVLWRVESLSVRRDRSAAPDPHELRRRAFAGMRALLRGLAARQPIILFIDDLQWGDGDSAALLSELLRPPDTPPLLLVGSYRSDEASGPLVRALVDTPFSRSVEVGPLPTEDAERLAVALLPEDARMVKGAAEIAIEAEGNPYFVAELARHLLTAVGSPERTFSGRVNLDSMLWERVSELPAEPRRLLEMIAVAGRPLGQALIARAANLAGDSRGVVGQLRAANLVRTHGVRDRDGVSTYHDRIRETVVAHMDERALVAAHRALALELEATGDADAEALAEHYHAAGEDHVAARYAATAADHAARALAFERAARLYALSLEIGDHDPETARELGTRLGDALANCGRGAEGAEAYLAAAEGASSVVALDLRRRAAEQFLVSGVIDRGMETMRDVLSQVGVRMPKTRRRAIIALLARRLQNRLSSFEYTERDESQLSPEQLSRIDVLWSAVAGLTHIDIMRAMVFQARHMRLALKAGEPYRIARGFALEAGFLTTVSDAGRRRAEPLISRAEEMAHRIDAPYVLGLCQLVRGVAPSYAGRWRPTLNAWTEAVRIFRDECVGVHFEKINVEVWLSIPLFYLGEIARLSAQVRELVELGRQRNNHFYEMGARTGHANVHWLAIDDPDGAQEAIDYAEELWNDQGVHLLHYHAMAQGQIALYRGDGGRAFEYMHDVWPRIAASGLLRLQRVRVELYSLLARAALLRAAAGDNVEESTAEAERAVAKLEKEHMPWSSAFARLAKATAAHQRGDADSAVAWLRAAESELRAGEMALHAAVAKRRRGQLVGGVEGQRLISEADRWMLRQNIAKPERMADVIAPGFRE